jgi:uncharacterized membrane protein YozB (DUF420 family)
MGRGLLGTRANVVADVNLLLQGAILIVLLVGLLRSRTRGLGAFRALMSAAVALNAVLIIAIMNPAFFRILPFALSNPLAPTPVLLWPHVAIGITAELIGVYLAVSGNLERDPGPDAGRRKPVALVGILLFLWASALAVGIAVYLRRYT